MDTGHGKKAMILIWQILVGSTVHPLFRALNFVSLPDSYPFMRHYTVCH